MRHLLICRELPPVAGGGVGAYTARIISLLAERGETVHVISQRWRGADAPLERRLEGRLVIHRVPCERPSRSLGIRPHRALRAPEARALFASEYFPQAFAWTAGLLAERLVEEEGIDVIEAPEYEAPLYFFQLRRALGLGPGRKPPCVIHLHSPSEIIARSNDWDLGHPYFLTAKRLEDYSMSAADALICPSHHLADEISARPDLACEGVNVIHYPAPGWMPPAGSQGPSAAGPVVHVGRVERRKGSIEWLDAAVAAARIREDAHFEFVGRPSLNTGWRPAESVVEDRIPSEVRRRFRLHGQRSPDQTRAILERARFAVVPSRWDNFPNTCVEAMSVGLPVLATRAGGMVQLVEDGESGWLSEGTEAAALFRALLRALDTPAAELEAMGRRASAVIRERCDPDRIVDAHLELKRRLVDGGAVRSLRTPPSLLGASGTSAATGQGRVGPRGSGAGVGVVVVRPATARTRRCLDALAKQTLAPATALLVRYDPSGAGAPAEASDPGIEIVGDVHADRASAIYAGVEAMKRRDPPPEGVVVLDERDVLHPSHIQRCSHVLDHSPEVGLVSFWEGPLERLSIRPCPARPYQWAWNDAAAASVMRLSALTGLDSLPISEEPLYERWYLANAVIASGWAAVTIPESLAERLEPDGRVSRLDSTRLVLATLQPYSAELAADAPSLLLVSRSGTAGTLRERRLRPREFSELARLLLADWRRALRWGWSRALSRLRS